MSENNLETQVTQLLEKHDPDWEELKTKQLIVTQLVKSLPENSTPEVIETHVLNYIKNEPPF